MYVEKTWRGKPTDYNACTHVMNIHDAEVGRHDCIKHLGSQTFYIYMYEEVWSTTNQCD